MNDRTARSVLVVEDEPLLAMDLERLLDEVGYRVMGPATSTARAIQLIELETPALTILDLNLGGEMVFPLLDVLAQRGIPFLIVSGHSPEMVPARHRPRPFMQKPYDPAVLLRVVHQILSDDHDRSVLKRA